MTAAPALVAGEYAFTPRDFDRIAAMLRADAGIALTEGKAALVYSRLAKRLRSLGLPDFSSYCTLLERDPGGAERREMLASLTTNVTRFLREPHHFEQIVRDVLPPLAEAARRGQRVRLWSAGCSTGEEPYTLALSVLEAMPDAANHDLRILATDIDPVVLETARKATYSEDALAPVAPHLRTRFFEPAGPGQLRARPALRDLVAFRELNLNASSWPLRQRYAAILCRNVAIYFDEPTQARLWSRFAEVATPGAWLFIGHSERVVGPAAARWRSSGLTSYRLAGGTP
ncbi:protein-glutamate O-methyltransferase [Roseomonas sp. CCTCC AB2023176]|uniref:protein-glutamate O-methyltransferase n=1 Tax=Roseomonas sp. CCTCC AB2023176 TaxID=3342640 RepID=UPI0035DDE8E7